MAKFTFPLATLLKLREQTRDEKREDLAEAYRDEEIIAEEERRLEGELSELTRKSRRASAPGRLDLARLRELGRSEALLRARRQNTTKRHRAARAEIEARLATLVEANRGVRVLETLRRRQLDCHRTEENRRDTREMDETAARSAAKGRDVDG